MKKKDEPKIDEEEPLKLTVYKPEGQIFQKLHLCDYLGELFETPDEEGSPRC